MDRRRRRGRRGVVFECCSRGRSRTRTRRILYKVDEEEACKRVGWRMCGRGRGVVEFSRSSAWVVQSRRLRCRWS